MQGEGEDRVRAAYRGNFARLRRAKRTYDPDDLFTETQHIPPA